LEGRAGKLLSEVFETAPARGEIGRPGDVLEISVWEAPPTVLFSSGIPLATANQSGSSSGSPGSGTSSNVTNLPPQMVDVAGTVYVPFAGTLEVTGEGLPEVEADIDRHLKAKANKHQVRVQRKGNNTTEITTCGE